MSSYSTYLKNKFTVFTRKLLLPDPASGIIMFSVTKTWNCVIYNSSSSLASPYNITTTIENQWPNLYLPHDVTFNLYYCSPYTMWILPPKQPATYRMQSTVPIWLLSHLGSCFFFYLDYSLLLYPMSSCQNSSYPSKPSLSITSMNLFSDL